MSVYVVDLPNLPGFSKTGPDDFLADVDGGPERMLEMLAGARRHQPPTVAEILEDSGFLRLTVDYDPDARNAVLEALAGELRGASLLLKTSVREVAIKHLKSLHVSSPARLVDAALNLAGDDAPAPADGAQGSAVIFEDVEPWDQPVAGATLLSKLTEFFNRFLILPAHAAVVMALWTLHTYVLGAADVTPYLLVVSAIMRCGKTRLLEMLECVAWRALKLSDASAAGIFRMVEKYSPAILLDEADAFLAEHQEMRGILNDGWQRGGNVVRVVGEENEPRAFRTFSPKVIAGIGELGGKWATVADRSMAIRMRRKLKTERVARFRMRKILAETKELRRQLLRWGTDSEDSLRDADPALPDKLNDRQQDAWEPLLAIADLAGDEWPELARKAALALAEIESNAGASSVQEQLLSDIKDIFDQRQAIALHSAELCRILGEIETRPWPEWKNGKPMTPRQLASQLKPFGIKPKQVWADGTNKNGYERESFEEPWARYLPDPNPLEGLEPNRINDFGSGSDPLGARSARGSEGTVSDSKDKPLEDLEDSDKARNGGAAAPEAPETQKIKGDRCRSCGDLWKWRRGPESPYLCATCHPPVGDEVTVTI
ncbi:MAG: DUF3631 domain-containing protein [Acidobacteria bacterium]|nr:DUF3631 domain-containing protein [Acidobacteriota bacterium]